MCSIFGVTSKQIPVDILKTCFERTVSRGPDMTRVERAGSGKGQFQEDLAAGQEEALQESQGYYLPHTLLNNTVAKDFP